MCFSIGSAKVFFSICADRASDIECLYLYNIVQQKQLILYNIDRFNTSCLLKSQILVNNRTELNRPTAISTKTILA